MAISSIPDLIISDIMMPEKDGYELTKEIKQNTLTNHIPIILLTAKAELHDKIYGLDTGADDYLTKPFYKIELLTRIRNLIEQRKNLKQKYSHKNILSLEHLPTISRDQDFIKKLQKVIEKHFSDESFSVQILQNEMGISRTQLHRKLKALTNKSASELIRTIRLEKAAEMISNKTGSISEIAYLCGFSDPSYFSRVFKEKYGCKPSEYIS
jgi:YesN/AraC family two-component response regulator